VLRQWRASWESNGLVVLRPCRHCWVEVVAPCYRAQIKAAASPFDDAAASRQKKDLTSQRLAYLPT